ncbi:MAG TPA: hypothetical protein EYQ26_10170, partial [Rhodospirillales bacterium]|nr:hypothetical protein [Rhodospirillales bacterium]
MSHKNFKYSFLSWAFILIGATLLYLIFGTGLHGDDYSVIKHQSLSDFLVFTPENLGIRIFGFPDYYIFWSAYPILGHEYQWGYDLIKWLSHLASVYMSWRFFSVFLSSERALVAAVLFILFPL